MTTPSATPQFSGAAVGVPDTREAARTFFDLWWLWLVTGVIWFVAALVILQFDQASITTVGIIVGCMFVFAGVQQLALASAAESWRWLWAGFGVLFIIAGIICFISPENTFAGMADILGFLFLTVGAWWTLRAFIERGVNPLWWLGLIGGLLMIVLAFWTSGQFFIEKAHTLLVFAGIWALMQGFTDFAKAFVIRRVGKVV
jgi:uncharacterized membrane protein HdeD (DUF308 family)